MRMSMLEFFDPKPVKAEEIENPEQDKFGDQTDDEMYEPGDERDEEETDAEPEGEGEMDFELQAGADDQGEEGDEQPPAPPEGDMGPPADEPEGGSAHDFEMPGEEGPDIEVSFGDAPMGDDPGGVQPGGPLDDPEAAAGRYGGETMAIMPHAGHGSDFGSSPDGMGNTRGTYGLKPDGMGEDDEIVDKSSAWDVLAKVVGALEKPGKGMIQDELC